MCNDIGMEVQYLAEHKKNCPNAFEAGCYPTDTGSLDYRIQGQATMMFPPWSAFPQVIHYSIGSGQALKECVNTYCKSISFERLLGVILPRIPMFCTVCAQKPEGAWG